MVALIGSTAWRGEANAAAATAARTLLLLGGGRGPVGGNFSPGYSCWVTRGTEPGAWSWFEWLLPDGGSSQSPRFLTGALPQRETFSLLLHTPGPPGRPQGPGGSPETAEGRPREG
ncbi:hypothetical protein NDU88_006695 [Pleurodeles waltl]|uniref:Uncharacterized protein n=1 Tax=Pleurodeles waltl TaxID=8319 RepID=A0AAV7TXY0_PLEWA|nr:hypothetical protein NDU88_006695 [Pleurodeles waltl]